MSRFTSKFAFRFVVLLVVCSILLSLSGFSMVKASGNTIYIKADGSVDPLTAPISSVDNVTYTLTDNINDSIVIGRDNIVVDGAGYTVQGAGSGTGITLSKRSNVAIKNMTIKAFGQSIWLYNSSFNNSIIGNNITNNEYGIVLDYYSFNNRIVGNNITGNNVDGIYLVHSSNNGIVGNNITSNKRYGIWFSVSSNNSIVGNSITNNVGSIFLSSSSNNVFRNNTMSSNRYNFLMHCSTLDNFIHDVDVSNTIDGKPVYYLINQTNLIINSSTYPDIGFLALVNSKNITIEGLEIKGNGEGILLAYTTNSTIIKNRIVNNFYGIWLSSSSYISIVGNNVANNYYSIWLESSFYNKIFNNNFIGNTYQFHYYYNSTIVWDDGYKSGGNYWSDYTGVDLYSGPYQNEIGNDGIGDTPYLFFAFMDIDDSYPLVGMFSSFNTSLGYSVNVISNSTIQDFEYFQSNSTIRMHVSNTTANQKYGFCRLTIPHSIMPSPYTIAINDNPITYTTVFENEESTTIYFSYEHSTLEIIIIPEFPSALILPLFMVATILAVIVYRRKHFQ